MLALDAYMTVLGSCTSPFGVLWVGSVFLFVVLVSRSGAAIAPAGAPPMPEVAAELGAIQARLKRTRASARCCWSPSWRCGPRAPCRLEARPDGPDPESRG